MSAEASPSAAALRMRRMRKRRVRGARIVHVEVTGETVDKLVRSGKLDRDDNENPDDLAFMLGLMIEEMADAK